ncbi:MAG TPA: hypothetical protein VFE54_11960 [Mucilaginibacter sp.]|nr:hypothetical protein [Mucilaginibacter sp.]
MKKVLIFSLRFAVVLGFTVAAAMRPSHVLAQQNSTTATQTPTVRDGQHDFDFNVGIWKTHISRLVKPLTGSKTWTELNGTVTVRKVWGGRAQIEEIEADGPGGRFEGLTLFLYNPQSRQWSMSFANSNEGLIDQPSIGEFKNGRGEFYQQDVLRGRSIMVRMVWSDITPTSHRVEQSYSDDGGKTWEPNFIGTLTQQTQTDGQTQSAAPQDVNHDFDFAFGTWKEHTSRLQHPLTGSKTWTEMEGQSHDYKLWNGKGNLTELESDGPNGHLELLALRLYNPQAHQWNLTFATSNVGVLGLPALVGEFKNGRGEFYDQELLGDKAIWVRFTVFPIGPDSMQSEQAFSNDGGQTWETNWINKYSRIKE